MADKKTMMQKFESANVSAKDVVGLVDKFQGKKGKLKVAGNKKLTKTLKKACAHHAYTKNGKFKNILKSDGNRLRCAACGTYVNTKPASKEDDEKLKRDMFNFYDQLEYLMVEANAADEPITRAIVFSKVYLNKMFKTKRRIVEALAKNGKKGKKNGKKGNKSDYSTMNGWMRR